MLATSVKIWWIRWIRVCCNNCHNGYLTWTCSLNGVVCFFFWNRGSFQYPRPKICWLSPFFSFIFLCLMQKHLREITPVSDRKGLWGGRVSGLFFPQPDGEKEGGGAVFLLWCKEKPALLLPSSSEVGLSFGFVSSFLSPSTQLCELATHTIYLNVFLS